MGCGKSAPSDAKPKTPKARHRVVTKKKKVEKKPPVEKEEKEEVEKPRICDWQLVAHVTMDVTMMGIRAKNAKEAKEKADEILQNAIKVTTRSKRLFLSDYGHEYEFSQVEKETENYGRGY